MSTLSLESLLGIACYCIAGIALGWHLVSTHVQKRQLGTNKYLVSMFGLVGVVFHALVLADRLFTTSGFNLSFTGALSAAAWLMVLLLLATGLKKPIETIGITVYPFAAATLGAQSLFPYRHIVIESGTTADLAEPLEIHILVSLVAYSLIALAAAQAILLAAQDNQLHNRHPGGFIRALPPLQTMEKLLFQLLRAGFILLSLSLLSGVLFTEDMFAQDVAHKTVFSIVSWLVFGTLLWGRRRFGWRSHTATRWTLSGFFLLMLAYFGSKFVLEIILERT